ncbi:uncharacterized protein LOC122384711 [Amphibalanus amphitrite]|uniref:uncharacterized protein LOC122384711 n=1 Tax=Amphibalanus amphitrite TaxID=1232801 RepID=UPI001C8FC5CF|nr:uncharacterized protein LOC122384711 [Amphibalanus amphitrite]
MSSCDNLSEKEREPSAGPHSYRRNGALGPGRLSRSVEETPSESRRPLRPSLAVQSRSVDSSPVSAPGQRRGVSFQLPESRASAVSRVAALAQRVKQLAVSAAASSGGQTKPDKAPKRILRQPVVHVYVRGASGLPTQRVPLAAVYRVSRDFRASSVS